VTQTKDDGSFMGQHGQHVDLVTEWIHLSWYCSIQHSSARCTTDILRRI